MATAYEKLVQIGWDVQDSGCWLFRGRATVHGGYGTFYAAGRHWRAHRVALAAHDPEMDTELGVLHSCHTPLCVNPGHLRSGSVQDNMDDKVRAGHQYRAPCPQGHDLTLPGATKDYANGSKCVECRRAKSRRYWERRRDRESRRARAGG